MKFMFQKIGASSTLKLLFLCAGDCHSLLASALHTNETIELLFVRAERGDANAEMGLSSLLNTLRGRRLMHLNISGFDWSDRLDQGLNRYLTASHVEQLAIICPVTVISG